MIQFLIMSITTPPHQHTVDVEALFQQHGIHCTAQRKTIWDTFAQQAQGRTARETVCALKTLGIGAATVYRTIELFERLGLLTSIHDDGGKTRYVAVCPGHSHTLICRGCHTVVEFDDCDLTLLEKLLMAKTGFAIQGHHLEVYGTCPACTAP